MRLKWGGVREALPSRLVSDQPPPPSRSGKPAGWYKDPSGKYDWRYFDARWTDGVANEGDDATSTNPVSPARPPTAVAGSSVDTAASDAWWGRRLWKLPVWAWIGIAVLAVIGAIAGGGAGDETAPSTTTTTTTPEVTGPTRDEVAGVLYGTATCPDDETCAVITGVRAVDDRLVIDTSMFPDADAEIPGMSACNAIAIELWEGDVWVRGDDGAIIATGRRDNTPFCELQTSSDTETSAGLTETSAWLACHAYGEATFRYGWDPHSALGMIAHEIVNDHWFFKLEADVTNQYGAEASGVVECSVGGAEESPVVDSFTFY